MQNELIAKATEGENASDVKCKISMCVLTNARNKLVFVTWFEESHGLMVTKGIAGNFQACKALILGMLKGAHKSDFKTAVDKCGCGTVDPFDDFLLVLAKLFFGKDCFEKKTEHVRNLRRPLEDIVQEFSSSTLIMQGKICCIKVLPEQEVHVWENNQTTRIAHNGCPKCWRNDLRKSSSKLGEISLDQLIKNFEPFDLSGNKDLKIDTNKEGRKTVQFENKRYHCKFYSNNHGWNPIHATDELKI